MPMNRRNASFSCQHMFPTASKKGTSDANMIVDAMKLHYTKPFIDRFVLVTSDSDIAPLALHLREDGKDIIGIGQDGPTSKAFTAACSSFMFVSASGVTQ